MISAILISSFGRQRCCLLPVAVQAATWIPKDSRLSDHYPRSAWYLSHAKRAAATGPQVNENDEQRRRLLLLEQQAVRLSGEATVGLPFRTSGNSGAKANSTLGYACFAVMPSTWTCSRFAQ